MWIWGFQSFWALLHQKMKTAGKMIKVGFRASALESFWKLEDSSLLCSQRLKHWRLTAWWMAGQDTTQSRDGTAKWGHFLFPSIWMVPSHISYLGYPRTTDILKMNPKWDESKTVLFSWAVLHRLLRPGTQCFLLKNSFWQSKRFLKLWVEKEQEEDQAEAATIQWYTKALFRIQFSAFPLPTMEHNFFPFARLFAERRRGSSMRCLISMPFFSSFTAERKWFSFLYRSHCINLTGYPRPKCALNRTCHIKIRFIAHLLNNVAQLHSEWLLRHGKRNPSAFHAPRL